MKLILHIVSLFGLWICNHIFTNKINAAVDKIISFYGRDNTGQPKGCSYIHIHYKDNKILYFCTNISFMY